MSHRNTSNRGPFAALEANNYDYQNLMYPQTLGSDGLEDFIVFYINEVAYRGEKYKSNFLNTTQSGGDDPILTGTAGAKDPNSNRSRNSSTAIPKSATKIINSVLPESSEIKTRATRRIKSAIALHMPASIGASYGFEYENQEDILSKLSSLGDFGTIKSEVASTVGARAASAVTGIDADQLKSQLLGNQRMATNPHMEQYFKGMNFRAFSFAFKFAPTTEQESHVIDNIIKTLKFYAHPEMKGGPNSRFFIYPAEFDIQYYHKNGPNVYLNKISTCALTSIETNYTGAAVWAAFKNGAPVELELTLGFNELEILTKARINEGY